MALGKKKLIPRYSLHGDSPFFTSVPIENRYRQPTLHESKDAVVQASCHQYRPLLTSRPLS